MAYSIAGDATSRIASELDVDVPVDLLSDRRRRHALECLRDRDAPLALADLARDVAARESNASPGDVSDDRAQGIRIDLYHVHLPKLDEAGLVAFDASERSVRPTERLTDR